MIIILEGANRCGKTTLAKNLLQMLDLEYFKDLTIDTEKMSNAEIKLGFEFALNGQANLLKALDGPNRNIIVDRFHMTEYVYGKMYRNYLSRGFDNVNEKLKDEAVIVYCKRKKNADIETTRLQTEFDELVKKSKIPVKEFDIATDSISELLGWFYTQTTEKYAKPTLRMEEGKCVIEK